MTPYEKLLWLQANAHEVHVTINGHRGYYETVEDDLSTRDETLFDADETDVKAECIRRNELVVVQVYPDTPISFYQCGHYDLGKAIDAAYECVTKEREKRAVHLQSEAPSR